MEYKECGHKLHEGPRLLPASSFYKAPNKTGLSYACKQCSKHYANTSGKVYREKNKEHLANASKRWREDNAEYFSEYKKQAYQNDLEVNREKARQYYREHRETMIQNAIRNREQNPTRVKEYQRMWVDQNKHKTSEYCMHRYARKKAATPPWYEKEKDQILEIYAQARQLTEQTGIPHQVDHIVPLRGTMVCGLHCLANLQILTKTENIKKKNKFSVG